MTRTQGLPPHAVHADTAPPLCRADPARASPSPLLLWDRAGFRRRTGGCCQKWPPTSVPAPVTVGLWAEGHRPPTRHCRTGPPRAAGFHAHGQWHWRCASASSAPGPASPCPPPAPVHRSGRRVSSTSDGWASPAPCLAEALPGACRQGRCCPPHQAGRCPHRSPLQEDSMRRAVRTGFEGPPPRPETPVRLLHLTQATASLWRPVLTRGKARGQHPRGEGGG